MTQAQQQNGHSGGDAPNGQPQWPENTGWNMMGGRPDDAAALMEPGDEWYIQILRARIPAAKTGHFFNALFTAVAYDDEETVSWLLSMMHGWTGQDGLARAEYVFAKQGHAPEPVMKAQERNQGMLARLVAARKASNQKQEAE